MEATSITSDNNSKDIIGKHPFPVYLIYSKWSLSQLDNFLGTIGDVGFLRIVYDKDGTETNRTIAIIPNSSYECLVKKGFGDYHKGLQIVPYTLNNSSLPGRGKDKTLFIPVSKELNISDTQIYETVTDKLNHLSEWGIIEEDSWSIIIPLKSREKGEIQGGCFISFNHDDIFRTAMVRVLLTDTYWPDQNDGKERLVLKCFWSRDRKARNSKRSIKKVPLKKFSVKNTDKKTLKSQTIIKNPKHANLPSEKIPSILSTTQPIFNDEKSTSLSDSCVKINRELEINPTTPVHSPHKDQDLRVSE